MKWDELETPHSHKSCKREVFNPVVSELKKIDLTFLHLKMFHVSNDSFTTQPATSKMTCCLHEHLLYLTAWLKTNVKRCPRHPNTSWEDIWSPKTYLEPPSQEVLGCLGPRVGSTKGIMFPSFQIRCWCFWYGDSAIDVETWARFAQWKDSSPLKLCFVFVTRFFIFKEWGVNLSVIFMIRERYKKGTVRKLLWFHLKNTYNNNQS